jgi:hypothetical protein
MRIIGRVLKFSRTIPTDFVSAVKIFRGCDFSRLREGAPRFLHHSIPLLIYQFGEKEYETKFGGVSRNGVSSRSIVTIRY